MNVVLTIMMAMVMMPMIAMISMRKPTFPYTRKASTSEKPGMEGVSNTLSNQKTTPK